MTHPADPPAELPPDLRPAPPWHDLPTDKVGMLLDLLGGWREFAREREEFGQLKPKTFRKRAGKHLDQSDWQRHHPPGYAAAIHHHYRQAADFTSRGEGETPGLTPRQYFKHYVLPLFDPSTEGGMTPHAESPPADPSPASPSIHLPDDKATMLLDLLAGWLELAGQREELGQLKPKKFHKRVSRHLHQADWQRRHPPGYGDATMDLYQQASNLMWPAQGEAPRLTPREYLERFVLPLFDPPTPPA